MMIMMAPEASPEQIRQVVARLEATGTVHPKVVPGASQIAVAAIGDAAAVRGLGLQALDGVDQVIPLSRPYKLASSELSHHAPSVFDIAGRRIGPDPASIDACMMGGILANNSSGMCCGVEQNSYHTLRSLTFVLPSGTKIDTGAPGAAERFAAAEPELVAGLEAIRDEIRADAELADRIRRKFAIKNTTGYRLCAFLDADEPLEIFRRLLVGSEGTLGFVAEAVFETVPLPARTTTAWVHFPGIDAAIAPVRDLVASGATAVELMVAPALITAAWNMVGAPQEWKELDPCRILDGLRLHLR